MYAVARRYHTDPASVAEVAERTEEGFVPIVSAVPGFVSYSLTDFGGGGISSLSIFQDQKSADESVSRAASFVRANLSPLLPNPPEVLPAEVRIRDIKAGQRPAYGVTRLYQADPADLDEIVRRVREGLLPILQGMPGYVSYTSLDFGQGTHGSASSFIDQAASDESARLAMAWVGSNLSSLLPLPPRVRGGRVLVWRTAD